MDTTRPKRPIRKVLPGAAALIVALAWAFAPILLPPTSTAVATSYVGYGDTGWAFADKGECCQTALALAQANSIRNCSVAGGAAKLYPEKNTKGTRGDCEWDGRGDGTDRVYRCTARTDIHCQSS